MRVYVDSRALIKRSVEEAESEDLEAALERHVDAGDVLVASSLAWVEVSRALRNLLDSGAPAGLSIAEAEEAVLSGVSERPITDDVVSLSRRVSPSKLRTLDAIHLATAILLDVDLMLTYDDRLTAACHHNGLATAAPGR